MFGQMIACEDAKKIIENGAQFIDVRTPMEHRQFALPGSVNIPLQELMFHMNMLDAEKPTILYCRSGARSGQAKRLLDQAGFKETYNLGAVNNYINCM